MGCCCAVLSERPCVACRHDAHAECQRMIPIDPDVACEHLDFGAVVEVNRITKDDDDPTVIGYNADIKIECAQCGERFRFIGVQAGLSPDRPMVSIDEYELRAPIRPGSADHDFGLGIPGYSIAVVQHRGHIEGETPDG